MTDYIDPICDNPSTIDTSLLHALTGSDFNMGDFKNLLCNVLDYSITEPDSPIIIDTNDYSPVYSSVSGLDFERVGINIDGLMQVGDPRISTGEVLKSVLNTIYPMAEIDIENTEFCHIH